ncbi:TatD family hydrolase [Vibrio genomosp. F10]|uniref:Deoxyribonuclease n=1 Tax=Vibrio genomosp. F10 str. ZF-129 TaxID=1187848 RepID=A0A1E5BBP9_9VIBR|nr:TatD family hydrolase [Vibrio genomosp. F10]OEE31607.1 deoxyribonuclease [Vibrio genomosp. F10 str. ZF-129]OEE95232.1 deoxyribonuclease [Vibrio genomosp. F10 str. 9ZC157]OEF08147.1 deoxyribonuclease [Vibrio genomosp. F10 str. 9ZB36]
MTMPPLFDTHCHFDFEHFQGDFNAELSSAEREGVKKFLIPAINESNWQAVQLLSSQHPQIYHALGFHPYFLNDSVEQDVKALSQALELRSPQCVAIGECGLDFSIDASQALQERYLLIQLELAQQYQLPVILHCHKANHRLIPLLKKYPLAKGGILHGFSGSLQQAMDFIELGFYIGVGGTITYPRANKTRKTMSDLPLDYLVIETDAPDMPMCGFQGKKNHPKMLPKVLSELALLKEQSEQTVAQSLWESSHRSLFICE